MIKKAALMIGAAFIFRSLSISAYGNYSLLGMLFSKKYLHRGAAMRA